jgi:molybdopterin converting factor small subunit
MPMNITVLLNAQVKSAAGTGRLDVELEENARFNDLITHIGSMSVSRLNEFLFSGDRQPARSLLFIHNLNRQIRSGENIALNDGDTISILSPISGG